MAFDTEGDGDRVQSEHFQEDEFVLLVVGDEIQLACIEFFLQIMQEIEAELRLMVVAQIVHTIAEGIIIIFT